MMDDQAESGSGSSSQDSPGEEYDHEVALKQAMEGEETILKVK